MFFRPENEISNSAKAFHFYFVTFLTKIWVSQVPRSAIRRSVTPPFHSKLESNGLLPASQPPLTGNIEFFPARGGCDQAIWPPVLITSASFPNVFFNSCNFQGNVQAFRLTELL